LRSQENFVIYQSSKFFVGLINGRCNAYIVARSRQSAFILIAPLLITTAWATYTLEWARESIKHAFEGKQSNLMIFCT